MKQHKKDVLAHMGLEDFKTALKQTGLKSEVQDYLNNCDLKGCMG